MATLDKHETTFDEEDDVEECQVEEAEETWEDWEEDGEAMKCFFCEFQHNQLSQVLGHAKDSHGFDFRAQAVALRLEFYSLVKLINFTRSHPVEDVLTLLQSQGAAILEDEALLIPVIKEDPMFCSVMELLNDNDASDDEDDDVETKAPAPLSLEDENAALKRELQECRDQMKKYSTVVRAFAEERDVKPKEEDNDTYYFESYSQVGIHKEMITDSVRTDSYRDAILNNRQVFEGKVVLDVGCGTGILSMFAAQAGAAKVIGIDCSDMGVTAKQIVADNGFGDVIEIIRGKVEEIELPVTEVDIIISEWMGYCLLYESMLDTVLFARDKWLVPGGLLFPDKATMHLQAVTDSSARLAFWENVYGFNMKAVRDRVETKDGFVEVVPAGDVLSTRALVNTIDIPTVDVVALDFVESFELQITRSDVCYGFVSSFDIGFEAKLERPLWFSTGVEVTPTHWQQVFFHVSKPFPVEAGSVIRGTWSVKRNWKNPRFLDVELEWTVNDDNEVHKEKFFIH
ncbi:Protein arginine N-methyltransferase 3 [Aphanomyces cochlioides]|nr:Protein arginine N-methyltransferase 3 [Aphanomyces cochlioides]